MSEVDYKKKTVRPGHHCFVDNTAVTLPENMNVFYSFWVETCDSAYAFEEVPPDGHVYVFVGELKPEKLPEDGATPWRQL